MLGYLTLSPATTPKYDIGPGAPKIVNTLLFVRYISFIHFVHNTKPFGFGWE